MVKKKKKSKQKKKEDFGSAELYCAKCNYKFEVEWETIWAIQECTHGYVGYHLNDTFISCDKCGEIFGDEEHLDVSKSVPIITDDELPF